jgi:hypothetical protein
MTIDATVRNRRKALGIILGVSVGLFLVGMVFAITSTLSLTTAIRETQKVNVDTNELIASCVTPKGDCYEASQERTGEAVATIGQASVYAATCADLPGVQGAAEIEKCVKNLFDKAAELDSADNPQ